jgi:predicted NUDIX family NTP pyrophosphohydrolase
VEPGEDMLATAIREVREETGLDLDKDVKFIALGSIKQKGGKTVHAWAFEGDWDGSSPITSTIFDLEWPPGSGQWQRFPEIDKAAFFSMDQARERLKITQQPLLDRLVQVVAERTFRVQGIDSNGVPVINAREDSVAQERVPENRYPNPRRDQDKAK